MRVYATAEQLAAFPQGDTVPAGSITLALRLASQVVDTLLTGRKYDTDTAGLPTDTDVAQAMADATCAIAIAGQAADAFSAGTVQQWQSVSIGSVALSGPSHTEGALVVAGIPVPAQALLALRSIGTLSVSVTTR